MANLLNKEDFYQNSKDENYKIFHWDHFMAIAYQAH